MKTFCFIGFYLSFTVNLFAQVLEGYVKEEVTHIPIPYFHVSIKGNYGGTVTNEDGYFRLSLEQAKKGDTIMFSHISYQPTFSVVNITKGAEPITIFVASNVTILQTVDVVNVEPAKLFDEIVDVTKKSAAYPATANLYYREFVRDNEEYNKYSDATLTVLWPKEKERLIVGVKESRVLTLPKEEEDIIQVTSPIGVKKILGYQYLEILDRFNNENRDNYMFTIEREDQTDNYRVIIKPQEDAKTKKSLYHCTINATPDKMISHIHLQMDSLTAFESSILGLTSKVLSLDVTLYFKEVNAKRYLSFGKVFIKVNFTHKRFSQVNEYLSEFLITDIGLDPLSAIDKKSKLKANTLYQHGNGYSSAFWEAFNIPTHSNKEKEIINKLNNYGTPE